MRLSHLGLRAQIVLSLAALLAVVFSFAAVAVLWVLKASVEGQRRELGEVAGRAVVLRVADRARDGLAPGALARLLSDTVGRGGVLSIAVYDGQGELVAARGVEGEGLALVGVDPRRPRSFAVVRRGEGGREEMLLVEPLGGGRGSVAAVVALETSGADLGRLARPVLIHLVTSGLLLLGFGYYSLTRLIVRPLETLTRATEKVAGGRLDVVIAVQGGWEIAAAARAFNDMTKRLRDQQDRLAQKVDELEQASEALGATQEQLVRSAKLASVGSLAAGLAHEVGNPVSAVLGLTEVLLDGGLEPHEEREYLERIRKETERVNRIVRDLLEYARSSPDDDDEPADVAEAVDSAVGLLSPQKSYREVDIQVVGDQETPPVELGSDALAQVLVNLMMNAADAVEGRGEVRVRFDADATLRRPGGASVPAVRISVSDSGPGVAEAHLDRIFEPFYTTKDPGAGTGLGLALCEGIVSRAGGTIAAKNVPGGGLAVTVVLPAATVQP